MTLEANDVEDILRLCPMQAGMLYHTLADPYPGMYLQQGTCRISGPLDEDALCASWARLAERRAALRTGFHWEGLSRPAQVIERRASVPVERADWRNQSPAEQQGNLAEWIARDLRTDFDLRRPPLLRVALIRLAAEERQLMWTYHHIILDAWSEANLLRDVVDEYSEAVGAPAAKRFPETSFARFLQWRQGRSDAPAEAYWSAELAGLSRATSLAALAPPASPEDAIYEVFQRTLPERLREELDACRIRLGVSLHTIAGAAWALLLSFWSGDADVVFGSTVSGRSPEIEGVDSMAGVLFNTPPVRISVRPAQRVGDWLGEIQTGWAEASPHHDAPLTTIRRCSGFDGPLFETVLVVLNRSMLPGGRSLGEARLHGVRYRGRSNYPLTLRILDAQPMTLELLCDLRAVDRRLAQPALDLLETAFAGLQAAPNAPVADVLEAIRERDRERRRSQARRVRVSLRRDVPTASGAAGAKP